MKTVAGAYLGKSGRSTRKVGRFLSGLLLLLSLSSLASCATTTTDATTTQYPGAPHFPPTDPTSVVILRNGPTEPLVRLGEITVAVVNHPPPFVSSAERRLREEAARLGADAAVVVHDGVREAALCAPAEWWRRQDASTIGSSKLVGVAIKYKK